MNKKLVRWIALATMVLMLMAIGLGCGSKDSNHNSAANNDKQDVADSTNNSTDNSSDNSEDSGDSEELKAGWMKDTSPVTLTWFVNQDYYTKQWDVDNCLLDKYITEQTGVTVEINSGTNEKLNAIIASGTLPDVITAEYSLSQVQELQEAGLIWAIDDLIEEYNPSFVVPESMKRWHGNENDGKLYGIVSYFYADEHMQDGPMLEVHNELKARKDIMDQLDIKPDDFLTKEGTLEALRKVRDAKVTYNGFDVVPAYFQYNHIVEFFAAPKEDKDGNYLDAFHQPEALEAAKFLNQLYRENLMPEDVLTMNTQMLRERIARGEVFSFTGHLYDSTDSLMNALYNIDKTAYNVHVGPLHNDNNDDPVLGVSPLAGWTISMITKQTEHPDRAIYLFDFLYSGDDIHITTWYGPEGEAWEWEDESKTKYKMTDQYLADFEEDPSAAAAKYTNGGFEWLANWIPIRKGMPVPTETHLKAGYDSDMYFSQWGLYDLPFTGINPQGGTDLAGVAARVDEIQLEYVAKMVTASSEEEVEAFFNEMIQKKKEVGYDELHNYRNEQFQKNKEKLGLDFAWPSNQK
ncbi:MAG: extracellular solute-binding protein [Caldicoprobacterales bacterium]|nr:extracellular solute-binding protein [Clostridiales bacterium]